MAKLKCPGCRTKGNVADGSFEVRGQFEGSHLFRCNYCGMGLAVASPFGRARPVPQDLWVRMCEIWDAEFANASQSDDAYERILDAANEVVSHLQDLDLVPEMEAFLLKCSEFAVNSLTRVADDAPHWGEADETAIQRATTLLVVYGAQLAPLGEWQQSLVAAMDWRPSEVRDGLNGVVLGVAEDYDLAEAASTVVEAVRTRSDPDVLAVVTSLAREAAGFDSDAFEALEEAPHWLAAFRVCEPMLHPDPT